MTVEGDADLLQRGRRAQAEAHLIWRETLAALRSLHRTEVESQRLREERLAADRAGPPQASPPA
jgi:hypothetical protein